MKVLSFKRALLLLLLWCINNVNCYSIFSSSAKDINSLKLQILQCGAALDRGQAYNPTSGAYYQERVATARERIEKLIETNKKSKKITLESLEGEWELVLTTVPHGIFRSSPFFLAIQDAYSIVGKPEKANLFFKLHELQTCSWGVSKIGRVAQRIDAKKGVLISEFDTSIFSLTVIPFLGYGKLLPTFGGCVATVSKAELKGGSEGKGGPRLEMEVDYTTAKEVPGLRTIPGTIGIKVPVGSIWKLLPWNKGRAATCSVEIKYLDDDFRIVEDNDGELFVYTRPVSPRELSYD